MEQKDLIIWWERGKTTNNEIKNKQEKNITHIKLKVYTKQRETKKPATHTQYAFHNVH